jgi:hypothetical protein
VIREIRALDGRDPYKLLDVPRDASAEAIAQAFKKQLKIWHPDYCLTDEARSAAEERTRLLDAARTVLLNHRELYDATTPPPRPVLDPVPVAKPSRHWQLLRRGLALGCFGYLLIAGLFLLLSTASTGDDTGGALIPQVAIPHAFAGVWTGEVPQIGQPAVKVRLSLPEGLRVGTDQTGDCKGNLVPLTYDSGRLTLLKSVTTKGCLASTLILTLLPNGGLALRYVGDASFYPPMAILMRAVSS